MDDHSLASLAWAELCRARRESFDADRATALVKELCASANLWGEDKRIAGVAVEILADSADTLHEKMLEAAEDAVEATSAQAGAAA